MIIDYILILFILAVAVYFDLKTFKIPNKLTYGGCLLGFTYSLATEGFYGLLISLVWFLVPVAILFLLFCFRFLGAGDIKLYSVIGSFIFSDVLQVIIWSMILGALYGLLLIIIQIFRKIQKKEIDFFRTKVHFSVPILVGVIVFMFGGNFFGL